MSCVNRTTNNFCNSTAFASLPFNSLNPSRAYHEPTCSVRRIGRDQGSGASGVCLVGLEAIVVAMAGTAASRPSNVGTSPDQTTVGSDFAQDPLAKADKLEITHVREAIEAEPVTPTAKPPNETPPQPLGQTATPKIVSRHWHDSNTKKVAAVSPDQRIKGQESKKSKNVERAKLPVPSPKDDVGQAG